MGTLDDLMLTFLLEDGPLYGEILVNGVPAEQFTQRDILRARCLLSHKWGDRSLAQRRLFNLSLSDMSLNGRNRR